MKIDGLPVNFTISEQAKTQIGAIRSAYLKRFPDDPPAMLVVWGTSPSPNELHDHEQNSVAVGYYRRSEFGPDKDHLAEEVSGLNLVFAVDQSRYSIFEGKVIDYEKGQNFFLRKPK